MDRNHQSKSARVWTTLVATAVIIMGTSGVAKAQAVLYGAAHTGGQAGMSTLYTINPETGVATPVGPISFNVCSGMDFHPATGILYAACFRPGTVRTVLITIDPDTGVGTEVNPTGSGISASVSDISFRNSDQTLYSYFGPNSSSNPNSVGTIDIMTGLVTVLPESPGEFGGNGIAFSPTDDVLFHAGTGADGVLNSLDPNPDTGGAAMLVAPLTFPDCGTGPLPPRINALDFQPETGILFGSLNAGGGGGGPTCLVTIDTTSGAVTLIGLTVNGLDALAWSPATEAPEMASHFECYKAKGRKVRETVKLEDRFGVKPRVRVREPELLCNPVNKNDEGIKNSDSHLTCYEIRDGEDDPKRRIGVKNQFGEQILKVKGAKLLCVESEILSVVDGQDHDNDDDNRGDGDDEDD